jgi:glutamine cyclotransferase
VIRADSRDFRGRYTEIKNFTTQQRQKIIADKEMIKLTGSEAFMIDAKADTSMTFESSDPAVIKVDEDTGRAETTGPGTAVITVKAKETDQYAEDSRKISVTVYPAEPVDIEGSEAKIMYHLSSANCETVMRVRGSGGASIPQSFAYTGKRYMVTFGMYGPTRIVRYRKDGSGRKVIKPKVSLGHPNGTTYDPERNMIYVLKGQGSSGFTLYDISNNDYLVGNFDRSCSGIGYDTVRKCLYTSSRSAILQYDPAEYTRIKKVGVTQHKEFMSIQDCACYDGILMHCLSTASNRHGFNYIDLYDMRHDKYIGTISCKLSEVESASVNEDGFLEVLSNGRGNANYIWRTDFNIKLLAKEFH